MMDTRFFWALVVMTLALFGWSYFFAPQPAVEDQSAQQRQTASPAATGASPAAPQTAPAEPAVPDAPTRDIVVTTPRYVAVFDEAGGRLKSLTLLKYFKSKMDPKEADRPMELVIVPQGAALPMTMTLTDESAPRLGRAPLVADREKLTLAEGQTGQITMASRSYDGLTVTKTLSFSADSYLIGQKVTLDNQGAKTVGGLLSMTVDTAPFSPHKGRYNGLGAYINGGLVTDAPDNAAEALGKFSGKLVSVDWAGYMDQYFLTALVFPEAGKDAAAATADLAARLPILAASAPNDNDLSLTASTPLNLAPGQDYSYDFDFYYGPKDAKDLEKAGHYLGKSVDLGWFAFLAKPLAYLLGFFNSLVHNYGVAIILVTVLIKILLWPLTAKSYRSMKEMQKLAPKVAKLREKYADDRERMNKEVMQLYKTFKVNPLGGCLPMLLQIPFFIAFYRVLDYALELRGAPFMLWIQDLSAPDRLGNFAVKLPLMELPTGIPVLTLLMGASMLWQQKMTPAMGDPMQARMMMLMPVVFTFILINMPAGLVLYWLTNNILSIGQQKLINRPSKAAS